MKINFEIEVPEEVVQLFIKSGFKEESIQARIKELMTEGMKQAFANAPEIVVALKSGVASITDVDNRIHEIASNISGKAKPKFKKE